jgi:hypothetical protein
MRYGSSVHQRPLPQILLLSRSLGGDRHHQPAHHSFVGLIGRRDPHGDGCAALIDKHMDFATLSGAISWVLASGRAAQWRRATAAVDRLPLLLDVACPIVKA